MLFMYALVEIVNDVALVTQQHTLIPKFYIFINDIP